MFIPSRRASAIRWTSLIGAGVNFLLSVVVYFRFVPGEGGFQLVEKYRWVNSIGADWHLGVDGISLFLVLLSTLLSVLCIISSWQNITVKIKEYHFFLLVLQGGMIGVFCALDLFLFYVMWEIMLVPIFFLIGVWGGTRRVYASMKFFLFTMAGSMLTMVVILYLYLHTIDPATGAYSFNYIYMVQQANFPLNVQMWLFIGFGLAFAIKVPIFPLHTWLPDAHTEAPTAGSVILAGVLLKMGAYGFLRFSLPLLPNASLEFAPMISVLALIGIIYGALVAMVQKDMKRLVAYSSVAHLGYVMLGVFALNMEGMSGSLYQQLAHGISTSALFLLVGVIYDRRHTRLIADYGGIAKKMPIYASMFMIISLSSIGLPGLNGFIGEFLILLGTFAANPTYAVLGTSGVILAAVYLLWMYQRIFLGPIVHEENNKLKDISPRECIPIVVLIVLAILMGVYPEPFFARAEPSLALVLEKFQNATMSHLPLP